MLVPPLLLLLDDPQPTIPVANATANPQPTNRL
jgi:hypothetical protein